MLSLSSASLSFAGAAPLAPVLRSAAVSMRAEGEIGVTPPLGVYDPLNLLATPVEYPRRDYERYVDLEIKHGRVAMLATLGIITTEAGFRWPGYLSKSLDIKFEDVPGGPLDSYAAVPAIGWLQIVAFCVLIEFNAVSRGQPEEPGNIGGPSWIRYDDPEVKKFKLNVRRSAAIAHSHASPLWPRCGYAALPLLPLLASRLPKTRSGWQQALRRQLSGGGGSPSLGASCVRRGRARACMSCAGGDEGWRGSGTGPSGGARPVASPLFRSPSFAMLTPFPWPRSFLLLPRRLSATTAAPR
jgi:light-harvesting complex I chlorophyll a/b binding protein 1